MNNHITNPNKAAPATIRGAGILLDISNKVDTKTTLYITKSTGSSTDCVIAVIRIKLAAVTVTPFKKYLINTSLRACSHNGKMKNINNIPGKKILNPPIIPARNENPVPVKERALTNAAKLKSGPGIA